MLQRFSRTEVLFYAVAKGKRFIAKPRDMVGVQKDYVEEDGSALILQTSVETDHVPEQSGLKRATLNLSGWHFRPEGNNIRVTYVLPRLRRRPSLAPLPPLDMVLTHLSLSQPAATSSRFRSAA